MKPESLLAQHDFVRALAGHLIRDFHRAEDVAQETWLRVLRRSPPAEGTPRGWLSRIVRNVVHDDHRRAASANRREQERALRATAPSTADVVDREAVRKEIVDAVLSLREPYRSAILLRFYELLPPRAIALQLGVPVGTVQTRIKRGLKLLRAALEIGSGRPARWTQSLVALARPVMGTGAGRVLSALALAGVTMKTGSKLTLAAALLLAICVIAPFLFDWMDTPSRSTVPTLAEAAPTSRQADAASTTATPPTARLIRPTRSPGDRSESSEAVAARFGVTLTGRVVDQSWRPVPRAPLRILRAGVPPQNTSTDELGRIKVDLGPWGQESVLLGTIIAGDTKVGACVRMIHPSHADPRSHDLGDLVLQPARSVDVMVRDRTKPVPGAQVSAVRAWGDFAPDVVLCDDRGLATLSPVPEGAATVLARNAGRIGRRECNVPTRTDPPLIIDIAEGQKIRVTVRSREDHRPIQGARVDFTERGQDSSGDTTGMYRAVGATGTPTDADGVATLAGISPDVALWVTATAPGFATPRDATDGPLVQPGTAEVLVELMPLAGARFPLADPTTSPADGTELTVIADPLAPRATDVFAKARVSAGVVVVDTIAPDFRSALVQAPDGRVGRIARGLERQPVEPVTFRAPRFLEVETRRPDGSAASSVRVEVCSYPIYGFGASTVTDGTGVARIGPFWGGNAEVYVDDGNGGSRHCSSAKMDAGDVRVRVDLLTPLQLVLRCTVDGERKLPPSQWLWVKGATRSDPAIDAEAAEIRCFLWAPSADATIGLELRATGYRTWSIKSLPLPIGSTITVDADLVSGPTVVVTVRTPPDGEADIELMEWQRATQRFRPTITSRAGRDSRIPGATSFGVRFTGVGPGRWCARDRMTGLRSAPVEVSDDPAPLEMTLDLSHAGWATGRVEAADPADLASARVTFSGTDIQQLAYSDDGELDRYEGIKVNRDGTFRLRVSGDRTVRLVPAHPLLVPAETDGEATVTAPRAGILLRLVRGGLVHFTVDGNVAPARQPDTSIINYAQLFRSGVGPVPVSTHRIEWHDGVGSFRAAPNGTWTIRLDLGSFQPKVLAAVTLDRDETDLGPIAFEPGSDLLVNVRDRPGRPARGIRVLAYTLDEPKYLRRVNTRPGEPCVMHGLGAGRFRVVFTLDGDADPDPRVFEIAADGHSPIQLDYETP